MTNKRKIYWLIQTFISIAFILLLFSCYFFKNLKNKNETFYKENNEIQQESNFSDEMRAIWVSFMDLDMKDTDYSENAFKNKFDKIIEDSKKLNINTLIVQVRPFSDALYPSSIFPWSHIVAKTQGQNPNYDPLKYMVESAHKNNLKIHAWVNPLRIQKKNYPDTLSKKNPFFYYQEDKVVSIKNSKYYNPGYSDIRKMIVDGIKEIVTNYEVDGIQLDDYFYPKKSENFDTLCFNNYLSKVDKEQALTHDEWQSSNINILVASIFNTIKSINPNIVFGISPEGNINNDIKVGADVYTWCKFQGYIDYICPQLYFNFENPVLPFKKAINTWKNIIKNENLKLYYGLGLYKAGSDVDNGTWKKSDDILSNQIKYAREKGCNGFMIFSYGYLNKPQTEKEVENVMKVFN